jgi:hypothetical protein
MLALLQPAKMPAGPCRRTARLAAVALALAGLTSLLAVEPIKRYPQLTLKDGRQLVEVEVVNYTMTDVLVRHSGGATMLHRDVLPNNITTDLHLPSRPSAATDLADPAFLALANKVAVAEVVHTEVAAPSDAQPSPTQNTSAEPLSPAGEGNFTESITLASTKVNLVDVVATKPTRVDLPGRVALTLPTGEHLFGSDIEVRAYPAALLNGYLEKARARANDAAEKLLAQASIAAGEGRQADYENLSNRAKKTADQYLEYIPGAPYSARSDVHGHFTLSHDLRDARLVASARVVGTNGEWTFRWIGLTADKDALLTEANATTVVAPEPARPRFAAR